MKHLVSTACLALLTSCVVGSPPGFSEGDMWTFPLVGPLEPGEWLVPVRINEKGPYLFAVDPDLLVSSIDGAINSELRLMPEPGIQVLNHDDNNKPTARVRVNQIEVGDLRVRNRVVMVRDTMVVRGRYVRGVLGRDVLAASLAVSFDRDRGIGVLSTQGAFKAPAGAMKGTYRLRNERFISDVTINGEHKATVHLDFGNPHSTLWPAKQKEMKLPQLPKPGQLRDEFGFSKPFEKVGLASKVRFGDAEASAVDIAPMADKRIREVDYDGELGQSFFYPFNVTINFHKTAVWLKPRTEDVVGTAKERMRRWGTRFDSCAHAACVLAKLEPIGGQTCPDAITGDESAGANADASAAAAESASGCTEVAPEAYQLTIGREAQGLVLEYEVTLLAVDGDGRPIGTPPLTATLPAGAESIFHVIRDPSYAKAAAVVAIDTSPFPKPCEKAGDDVATGYRCVW